MPHIIIEHSDDLTDELKQVNACKLAFDLATGSGHFSPSSIKVRRRAYDDYLVAGKVKSFIHITIFLLTGRDQATLKSIAELFVKAFDELPSQASSLSVDVREMDKHVYTKFTD